MPATKNHEYRGFTIVRLPRRWVVLDRWGSQLNAHSTLTAAKAFIDRLLTPIDGTDIGMPF
jgi:extradiol dioxygenase family protein